MFASSHHSVFQLPKKAKQFAFFTLLAKLKTSRSWFLISLVEIITPVKTSLLEMECVYEDIVVMEHKLN
ncbi:hypothetical protein KC851_00215 [Candidatus Kaiserbacteria bacterium]|nr:hypothetical protein [Candidatus Kaiserbacteria bacterium]